MNGSIDSYCRKVQEYLAFSFVFFCFVIIVISYLIYFVFISYQYKLFSKHLMCCKTVHTNASIYLEVTFPLRFILRNVGLSSMLMVDRTNKTHLLFPSGSAKERIPIEEEKGDMNSEDYCEFRRESECEKNRITWDIEKRCYLQSDAKTV